MPLKRFFRLVIIAEIVFVFLGITTDVIFEFTLPIQIQEYIQEDVEKDITTIQLAAVLIGVPLVLALITSWIGLFNFWRPARWIYTFCCFAGLPLYLLLGNVVCYTSAGVIFNDLSLMFAGVIIAMAYFSPIRKHFDRKPPKKRVWQPSNNA